MWIHVPRKGQNFSIHVHSFLTTILQNNSEERTLPCFQASRHFLSFLNAFQIILGWFWQHVIHWDSDSQGLWFGYQLLLVLLLNEQFTTFIAFGSLQNSAKPEWKDLFIGSSFSRGATWDFEWLPQVCGVRRKAGTRAGTLLLRCYTALYTYIYIYIYFFTCQLFLEVLLYVCVTHSLCMSLRHMVSLFICLFWIMSWLHAQIFASNGAWFALCWL